LISKIYYEADNTWELVIEDPKSNFDEIKNDYSNEMTIANLTVDLPAILHPTVVSSSTGNVKDTYVNNGQITIRIIDLDESTSSVDLILSKHFQSIEKSCTAETTLVVDLNGSQEKDGLCTIEITEFSHLDDSKNWQFVTRPNQQINGAKNYFTTNFRLKVEEKPNDPDLFIRNHRVYLSVISTSGPELTFPTITEKGGVLKYAIAPDWGSRPQSQIGEEYISFSVKACAYVDYQHANGTSVCTISECVTIDHVGSNVDSDLPELTKFEMMKDFPVLERDNSAVLVEINLDDNLELFPKDLYDIRSIDYKLLPRENAPALELFDIKDDNLDIHSFQILAPDNVSLEDVVFDDYEYDILFTYEILKREGAELVRVDIKEETLPLTFPIEGTPELPMLTKFKSMQDFPILESDKSILVKLEIEDNALEFPDYDIEYGEVIFKSMEESVTLEVIERDDNSHTYKLLPKDPVTLEPMDITVVELDINAIDITTSFDYKILTGEDPGALLVVELDTSIVLPFIPITPPCDLQITNFTLKTNTYPFITGNQNITEGESIEDAFLLDFSIDTREQPNRTDLFQQNHRIDYTINSSSIPIVIDAITENGRVQKYAIVPDWGDIPAEERTIDAISFDIDACLSIDFNDDIGNSDCTQVRCLHILNVGEDLQSNTECNLIIEEFSVSTEFEEGDLNFLQFPEPQSEFFFHTFNRDLTYDNSDPDYVTKIYDVVFETIESNIPMVYTSINNSTTEYATIPLWEESFDVVTKQDISYKAYACFSADLIYKEGTDEEEYVCPVDSCMIIEFIGSNVSNDESVGDSDCSLEIQEFSVSTEFEEGDLNFLQFADPQSEFFFHTFNRQLTYDESDPDYMTKIYDVVFETIESNIPMVYTSINNSTTEYATIPLWEESFDVVTKQDISYKAYACFSADLIYKEGTDEEEYVCPIDSCMIIEFVGSNLSNDESDSDSDCNLLVDFTIEKDQVGLHIFNSTIANEDPTYAYDYSWEFSDGETTGGESTTHNFLEPLEQNATLTVIGPDQFGNPCEVEITKSLNIRPGCDYLACSPSCGTLLNTSLKVNDKIKLCGDLEVQLTSITGTASNASGSGIVRIPWLLSDLEVEFSGIKVNSNYELCDGEILAKEYDTAPTLPQDLATNVALGILDGPITAVDNYMDGLDIKQIPEDAVIDAAEDQITPIRVPLGFNRFDPNTDDGNKTNYSLAISEFKFTPGQNYMQAYAAVELNDEDITFNGRLYFKSNNFFFNASGPILSTGNTPDLGFEILRPTKLQYGTNNGDPIHLIFNDDSQEDSWGGTSLKLTSECNQPYRFCLKADIDIEMPNSWFEPLDYDPNNPTKVKANSKIEFCDFKNIIIQLDLPKCNIPGTNGMELEVQDLTWDHSLTRNADNFSFPSNYNQEAIPLAIEEFKGFYLKSANILLPEDLSSYENNDRLSIEFNDWIFHKGYGVTGKIEASNIINFPSMNVADLGASIDEFKLEILHSQIVEGYLKGEITLPICDEDDPSTGLPTSKLEYRALYGSYPPNTIDEGLLFQINPQETFDCPFFANGELTLLPNSNIYVGFTSEAKTCVLTLNGSLGFPDKELGPVTLKMGVDYEGINLNYTKPRGGEGYILFDHGVWSFASPQKDINKFKFTIENFEAVSATADFASGELYVGGLGFDAKINIGDKIGGNVGLNFLGAIRKEPGQRLKAQFKTVQLSEVGIKANLSAVSIEGNLEFINNSIDGKAVKGDVSAEFKMANVGISASALFGNTFVIDPVNGFKYWKVEAAARLKIPLFPGFEIAGFGAGAYKNMLATGLDNASVPASADTVFPGVTFSPQEGGYGFGINIDAATTPKEESANATLGFTADFSSSGGIQNLGINGQLYSGCTIQERKRNPSTDKAILAGNISGNYNFPNKIFHLNSTLALRAGSILSGNAFITIHSDGDSGEFYFHAGKPDQPNHINVNLLGASFTTKNYFMFGNSNIYGPSQPLIIPADFMDLGSQNAQAIADLAALFNEANTAAGVTTNYFMAETVDGLVRIGGPGSVHSSPPNYLSGDNISLGKGFAFGIGLNVQADGNFLFGAADYYLTAGAEFNLSLLNYGQDATCLDYGPPIGINGYYMNTNLAAYFYAQVSANEQSFLELGAAVQITAKMPNPWGIKGTLSGVLKLGGIGFRTNLDIEAGELNCNPAAPNLDQTFDQEYVQETFEDDIVRRILLTDGQDFDPREQITLETNYPIFEQISLPERQEDGSIITRVFEPTVETKLWIVINGADNETIRGRAPTTGGPREGLTYRQNSFGQYEWYDNQKEFNGRLFNTLWYDTVYQIQVIEDLLEIMPDGSKVSARDRNGNRVGYKVTTLTINTISPPPPREPQKGEVAVIIPEVQFSGSSQTDDNEDDSEPNDSTPKEDIIGRIKLNKLINQPGLRK